MEKQQTKFLRCPYGLALLMVVLLTSIIMPVIVTAGPKVEVCHIPPGNPDNFHTITVSEKALDAHLAHGDLEGACNENCQLLCDTDGDPCTMADDGIDCELEGCPDPVAVDCDDGLDCTDDECESGIGCSYSPNCPDGQDCDLSSGECVDVCLGEGADCVPGATDPIDQCCPGLICDSPGFGFPTVCQ